MNTTFHLGSQLAEPSRQLRPAQLRHDDGGQDQIDAVVMRLGMTERLEGLRAAKTW